MKSPKLNSRRSRADGEETMSKHKWTRDDTIIALYLYYHLPAREVDMPSPEINRVAELIGVKSGSVRMKIRNFRSLDPQNHLPSLSNCSRLSEEVWEEFLGNKEKLKKENERIIAEREGRR